MQKTLFALVFATSSLCALQGQSTFQNLDFESAQTVFVNPPYDNAIATTNALPYWSAFSGTNQLAEISYGGLPGAVVIPVALLSTTNGGSLDGNYSIWLAGAASAQPTYLFGSISQTGLVPVDAQSLLFRGALGGPITIMLGSQDLSYIAISNALNYTLYGAIIPSTFAGQTETLTFSAGSEGQFGYATLDDIQFSSEPIPEPTGLALILLGGGLLFCRRRAFR